MHDDVAAYIGRWEPSSVSAEAAAFARTVISGTGPRGRERTKNLLWAAGKLADYGIGLGLEAVPEVLLHPSVTERFTRCAPGLSGVARLLAAAASAGAGLVCGGADPDRRNLTNPLIRALDGGGGLPRLDTSRLRATWLADCGSCSGWPRSWRRPGSAAPSGSVT